MNPRHPLNQHRVRLSAALLALLASGTAQAVVGTPGATDASGSLGEIAYGNTGNVFQFDPMLFVQGLGGAKSPTEVVALNPLLQYSFTVSGANTGLMTVEYRLSNTSALQSFSQLRFMLFANPDGEQVNFLDRLSETWGARLAGDPLLREGRGVIDPSVGIKRGITDNNTLSEGALAIDAACTAAAGCDAAVGLQWTADELKPGQMLRVRVGLSDNGQALSSRWIDAQSVDDAGTMLRISGNSAVVAVPEPGAAALMLAGLLGMGFMARRRRAA